eukprot:7380030-Prymnesium_polylepis.3
MSSTELSSYWAMRATSRCAAATHSTTAGHAKIVSQYAAATGERGGSKVRKRKTTGAYMQSAMENCPKRKGPLLPYKLRHCSQISTIRSTSDSTAGSKLWVGERLRTFIGIEERSAPNPECISATTARARARAEGSDGHKPAAG